MSLLFFDIVDHRVVVKQCPASMWYGLARWRSMTATATRYRNTRKVAYKLLGQHVILCAPPQVFVNGIWVGVHREPMQLVGTLRELRRQVAVNSEVGALAIAGSRRHHGQTSSMVRV